MPSPSESSPPPREPAGRGSAGDPGRGSPAAGSAEDALRRLEERLDRASQAAERLMAEAAARAAGTANPSSGGGEPPKPPPSGWQVPDDAADAADAAELDPLVTLLQAVRDLIPPDLQRRLVAALRELLLALRALIDWYLERLERRREQGVEVEDIPIL